MHAAFGTGATSLATLCGALSSARSSLQDQDISAFATNEGFRVAEDVCLEVLRGLAVRISVVGHCRHWIVGGSQHREGGTEVFDRVEPQQDRKQKLRGGARASSGQDICICTLRALAAGLQHDTECADGISIDGEEVRQRAVVT